MRPLTWWLAGGTEQCPACVQWHQYHATYRCAHCDGPVCTGCVLVELTATTRTLLCPDCRQSSDED